MKVSLFLAAGNLFHRHFTFLESNFLTGRDLICYVMKSAFRALTKSIVQISSQAMPWEKLPDDPQIQKDFWVHKRCPQIAAVNIEISNLVHSGHPLGGTSADVYTQKSHQIIKPVGQVMKGITLLLLKIAIKTCSFPSSSPKVMIHWSSTPENSNTLSQNRKPSTDNNIGSFYVLYYKSTAEINEPCR